MNIGELKNEIRHVVLPKDDVERLVQIIKSEQSKLTRVHQSSLLSTCIKYDAAKCFKLLYNKYYCYQDIKKYAPLNICLFLIDDIPLFHSMCLYHRQNTGLAPYFCRGYENLVIKNGYIPNLQDSINFYLANNIIPAIFILSLLPTETIITEQEIFKKIKNIGGLKPYCDKYKVLWDSFSHASKLKIDKKRLYQEDREQLINFPWNGFVDMHVYVLWDILRLAYPDNVWICKINIHSVDKVCSILKTTRRILRNKHDKEQLLRFPFEIFFNNSSGMYKVPIYTIFDILRDVYPDNVWLAKDTDVSRIDQLVKKSYKRIIKN
uniref:Uncharacterized protein n=1 Tax=viral metagenome TaxID=1070528 RepID=A0A6C0JUR5_9ZZZZ